MAPVHELRRTADRVRAVRRGVFPSNGQNVVFALYLIGIAVAVLSALAVRHSLPRAQHFVLELPAYHLPTHARHSAADLAAA